MFRSAGEPVQQAEVSPIVHEQPSTLKGLLTWLQLSGWFVLPGDVGITALVPASMPDADGGAFEPATAEGLLGLATLAAAPVDELLDAAPLPVPLAADGCVPPHAARHVPSNSAHDRHTRLDMPPTWRSAVLSVHPFQRLSENAHSRAQPAENSVFLQDYPPSVAQNHGMYCSRDGPSAYWYGRVAVLPVTGEAHDHRALRP